MSNLYALHLVICGLKHLPAGKAPLLPCMPSHPYGQKRHTSLPSGGSMAWPALLLCRLSRPNSQQCRSHQRCPVHHHTWCAAGCKQAKSAHSSRGRAGRHCHPAAHEQLPKDRPKARSQSPAHQAPGDGPLTALGASALATATQLHRHPGAFLAATKPRIAAGAPAHRAPGAACTAPASA